MDADRQQPGPDGGPNPADPPRRRPHLVRAAGLGLGLGVGLTVGRELGDSRLTRIAIGGATAVAVTLLWSWLVWLLFLRPRKVK